MTPPFNDWAGSRFTRILMRSIKPAEVVYHQIREDLEEQGVIFMDTDTALREHPEFFEEYWRNQNVPEPGAACTGAIDGPGKQS